LYLHAPEAADLPGGEIQNVARAVRVDVAVPEDDAGEMVA